MASDRTTGELLRGMFTEGQLCELDRVREAMLRDPTVLDNRKKGNGDGEGQEGSSSG